MRTTIRLAGRLSFTACLTALVAAAVAGPASGQCLVRAQAGAAFQELTFGVASANDATAHGSTGTTASYGELSASSSVVLTETQSDDGSSPIPIARWEDEWTVTVPTRPGLFSGTMTVAFFVVGEPTIELDPGGIGAIHNMNTSYNLIGTRNGGGLYSVSGGRIQATGSVPELNTIGTVPAPGRVLVDLPVVFGVPFTIGFDLISTTGGNQVLQPGQSGFVLGNSNMGFFWDGIVALRDGAGDELLPEAVVASCSGTNWLESQAPLPVPAGPFVGLGVALLAVGLGARELVRAR